MPESDLNSSSSNDFHGGRLREWDYICDNPLRQSAHRALKEEYRSAFKASKSDKLSLEQGHFTQQIGDYYCYIFDVSQLTVESYSFDKPKRIEINNREVDGDVTSAEEGKIEIHLAQSFGNIIHELCIIFDMCILLDLVDRRIVEIDRNPTELHSSLTHSLFEDLYFEDGQSYQLSCDHKANLDYRGLSDDQLEVVQRCLTNTFTLIWGPPGTGKSYTLLALIAELLSNDKKILFSSNTNTAIDNVLGDIVNGKCPYPILNEFQENAKIVRLGSQAEPKIKEYFSPKGLALTKSQEIRDNIANLNDEKRNIDSKIVKLNDDKQKWDAANEIIKKYEQILSEIKKYEELGKINQKLATLEKEFVKYEELSSKIAPATDKLLEHISNVKKIISKCNDESNATNSLIIKISKDIDIQQKQINDIDSKIKKIESSWIKKRFNGDVLKSLKSELDKEKLKLQELDSRKDRYNQILDQSTKNEVESTLKLQKIIAVNSKYAYIYNDYKDTSNVLLTDFYPSLPVTQTEDIKFASDFFNDSSTISFLKTINELLINGFLDTGNSNARNNHIKNKINTLRTSSERLSNFLVLLKQLEPKRRIAAEYIEENKANIKEIDSKLVELNENLKEILNKIIQEEKRLEKIEQTIIEDANILCLTMVKASYDKKIIERKFDVLIIDEFSMVSLPQLYCVTGLVKEKIILCGDHLQLPPICQSDDPETIRWMGESFYEWHSGNKTLDGNEENDGQPKITQHMANLVTQHRMPPSIADLIRPWYREQGLFLKDKWSGDEDAYLKKYSNHVLLENQIVILDTTKTNCYSTRSISKSRYNLAHAAITGYLCKEFVDNHNIDPNKIICLSPYKHQSSLIKCISYQINPENSNTLAEHTWTIHKSQGRGGAIVIYDLTDGVENGLSGFHKSKKPNLLNVAISRSKARLIIICSLEKMLNGLNTLIGNPLRQVFERMAEQSVPVYDASPIYNKIFKKIDINEILSTGSVQLTEEQRRSILPLSSYEYYKVLAADINNAQKSILIVSPFITPRRIAKLEPLIMQAILRSDNKLRVEIITRPPEKMFDRHKEDKTRGAPVRRILDRFHDAGVKVTLAYNTHEKLIIIDEKINYWGSLNPLSYKDTDEVNTRLEAEGLANKLLELAVQGRTEIYKGHQADNNEKTYQEGLKNVIKNELKDLRWYFAGLYKRKVISFLYNNTIDQLINNVPCSWADFFKIPEFSRKNSVLPDHIDQIEDIIFALRGYRLDQYKKDNVIRKPKPMSLFDIVTKKTCKTEPLYLFDISKPHETQISCSLDIINKDNNNYRTLNKIMATGDRIDPCRFTFKDCTRIILNYFDEMSQKSMKKDIISKELIKSLKVNTRGAPYANLVDQFDKSLEQCISNGKLVETVTRAGVVRVMKPSQ